METEKTTFRQVFKIRVPQNTKWDSDQSLRLMTSLFAINRPLSLVIRTSAQTITWYIEIGQPGVASCKAAVQAAYPTADMQITPKTTTDIGYCLYHFETGLPGFASLKSVQDFKKSDPLAGIVAAMKLLNEGEEFVYELLLFPSVQDYDALMREFLTKSDVRWADFITEQGRIEALYKQTTGSDRTLRFDEDITQAVVTKVNSSLMDARLLFKVKVDSASRAETIIQQFIPPLVSFDSDMNFLAMSQPEAFPLLLTPGEAAALWHLPNQDIQTVGVEWLTGVVTALPSALSVASKTRVGDSIVLGTNTFQGQNQEVRLPYADRITHVNLIGRTRVGKSTLLHHMIHQDIANGKGVGVIDPHGDLVKAILASSIPDNRKDDVVLFDVSDEEYPIGLNLFQQDSGMNNEATAGYLLAVMRKIFADQWSASRMEDVMYSCLTSLLGYPNATIMDIPRILTNPEFRSRVLKTVRDPVALDYWRNEFEPLSENYKLQIAQPINTRLRRMFRDPTLRRILGQNRSLDFRTMLNQRKIFLANLGGMAEVEAETLGSLMVSKMQMAAMSRVNMPPQERTPFYFYIDEVQNFVTTSLSKMLSEAAKCGLSLVIANQFLKQLEGDTLAAVLGNIGTTVIFRVGVTDAKALESFVKPHATDEDLQNLDRFHTVVKMQLDGQTLPAFSMLTAPPLLAKDNANETTEHIRQQSRETYGRAKDEIDKDIDARYGQSSSDNDNNAAADDSPKPFIG